MSSPPLPTATPAGVPLILPATDHPVTHVTVYRDRAEVARRVASVSINRTAPTTVQLRGLPRSLDTNSVRVEPLTNASRVLIADVQVVDRFERVEKKKVEASENDAAKEQKKKKVTADDVAAKRTELESARVKVEDLVTARLVVQQQLNLIKQYSDARASTVKLDSGTDLVKDFVAGFVPSHEQVGKELTMRKVQLDEQVKDAEAVASELHDWIQAHEYLVQGRDDDEAEYGMVMSVVITLEVPDKAGGEGAAESIEADLLVSYVVPNARWSPHYDLRVYSRDNLAHLTYNANLRQWTGEDWTNAQLILSTASIASIGHDLPNFTSRWELREHVPPPVPRLLGYMKRSAGAPPPPPPPGGTVMLMSACEEVAAPLAASAMVALPPPAPKPMMSAPKAEVMAEDTGLTAAAFKIAMPTTVPSDNVDHRVAIAVLQLPVAFARVAVPRLAPGKVFLEGTVANESDYVLVPGEARVGIDGSFVGKSALDLVMPKATFKLNLGLDPTIEITLKPTQRQTELGKPKPTGALALFAGGGNVASPSTVPAVAAVMTPGCKVVMHTNRMVIANKAGSDGGSTAAARVRVSDQVPTAQHADIHIVLVEPDLSKGPGVAVQVKASRNAADESSAGASTGAHVSARPGASSSSMGSLMRAKSTSAAKLAAAPANAGSASARLPVFFKDVGELEWDVDVDAGKSTEIVCKYAVVYPKDFKVEGLGNK